MCSAIATPQPQHANGGMAYVEHPERQQQTCVGVKLRGGQGLGAWVKHVQTTPWRYRATRTGRGHAREPGVRAEHESGGSSTVLASMSSTCRNVRGVGWRRPEFDLARRGLETICPVP
jgi:hypothetical protein